MHVFEKVRFTGTIITIEPDTRFTYLILVLDGQQHFIQAVDNFIGKHIFINFNINCVLCSVLSHDSRIDNTTNQFFINVS
ncbi:hypothetical protein SDC9_195606 [bioreactor metagenome]|uniref:Uncharacterized protein n=1 Tax=bioreactor metagenome TaxID=1076179 RepID=A0A645IB08_9ZZZZ